VRIIAGSLGGRRIEAPRGRSVRPTSERVREAIFSTLGNLDHLRVLDLFAGSGALAIESLSRGADAAVAVESSAQALRALERNVSALGLRGRLAIVASAVQRAASALAPLGPFDLLLADPPYRLVADGSVARAIDALLAREGLARHEATLVIEHAARDQPPQLKKARLTRTRRYGDTAVSYYLALPPVASL
jgi:16S rRNA (guanine(966)-N(2))-methyltransferase RsmD